MKKSFLLLGAIIALPNSILGKVYKKQPNIIFILTDDQRWDAMGYAGNKLIHTPEMDRLANDGTYFKNAFVTTPISAASRASILTGLYERTTGYTFQQGELKESYRKICYPEILRKNGYYIGYFGKLGVSMNTTGLFDKSELFGFSGATDKRSYFFKKIGNDTVHLTRYTGYKGEEFIENVPSGQPFCLTLSFSAPHAADNAPDQYFWDKNSDRLYHDFDIPPPLLGDDIYFYSLPEEVRKGLNRVRWEWRFDAPEKYQHSIKGYYRMISDIDDEIGMLRKLLQKKGLAENTIIIFMGDNGYFLGERQLAGKWLMYDNSLRVPMTIYDPRAKHHYTVTDMVLNIDIPKTILDAAGVEVPKQYQGISLVPYLYNRKSENVRKAILFEHLWEIPEIPSSEGIRTNQWKYFRYRHVHAPEELYDLGKDPLEKNNLADNPKYKKILEKLRIECDDQINIYLSDKIE